MATATYQTFSNPQRNARVDRWFFTGMALAMLAVAATGFLPSIVHPAARRAALSPLVAAHGILFFAWLSIFLVQSRLVAAKRVGLHRRVGVASASVLAVMIPVGYATTVAMVRRGFDLSGDLRIDHDPLNESIFPFGDLLMFTVLVIAAIAYRHRPEIHKRLMLFANISLMGAPLAHFIGHTPRLAAMPGTIIMVPISMFLIAAVARDYWLTGKVCALTLGLASAMFVSGPLRATVIGPSAAWHRVASCLVRYPLASVNAFPPNKESNTQKLARSTLLPHRADMHAIRHVRPAPQLREYVRSYAERKVRLHDAVVVHPAPARATSLLEFVFGDPIKVRIVEKSIEFSSPRAVVVGMQTHCNVQLQLQGTLECFVILFQPTGMHHLFSIPMHELTDRSYEAHSVLGPLVSRLEQRLGECTTFEERVRIADEFLSRCALDVCGLDGISAAASQILLSGSDRRIAALAGDAGFGIRQFERRFIQHVGMRPKLFARIARFEGALDLKARSATKSWTDVAHEFGYYDQMHMVHDFAEFTGDTPTNTLNRVEMLFGEQIKAMRSGRLSVDANSHSRLVL